MFHVKHFISPTGRGFPALALYKGDKSMRLIKEILGLYDRNLIDMDEALHYYDLMRQHDMNLLVHNKVVPLYYINNLRWKINDMRNKDNKTDTEIIEYILKSLDELYTVGRFADNHTHPYKNWGRSTRFDEIFKI